MTIIKTKNFTLRPLTIKDLKAFFETMQDEQTKKALNSVPKDLEEAKEEIKKMLKKVKDGISEIFTIEINNKYAGNIILEYQDYDTHNNEGRVHLWLHPDFRGKGLATKTLQEILKHGFNKRKFKRIFAQCKASNKPIVKLNKKLGFKIVKTHVNEFGVKKILWVKNHHSV